MKFDKENYKVEELTLEKETIRFRAFRNLVYVEHPVNEAYQQMNLFVPEVYYEGGKLNGYTLKTAPVFMPNLVGGYMPGELDEPGYHKYERGTVNSISGRCSTVMLLRHRQSAAGYKRAQTAGTTERHRHALWIIKPQSGIYTILAGSFRGMRARSSRTEQVQAEHYLP